MDKRVQEGSLLAVPGHPATSAAICGSENRQVAEEGLSALFSKSARRIDDEGDVAFTQYVDRSSFFRRYATGQGEALESDWPNGEQGSPPRL